MKKPLIFSVLLFVAGATGLVALQAKKVNRLTAASETTEYARPSKAPPSKTPASSPVSTTGNAVNPNKKQIRLALLLDTSNSMDGLIDQAKSQLWNIVDELADAEHAGLPADLHIALYEYGNDNLSMRSGYVRQVSTFTQDLDEISRLLFELNTNGGSEYCGAVIKTSLEEMDWQDGAEDLKMIFIAGNEEFNQGNVNFEAVCKKATNKGILVNTIYCGGYQEGIDIFWQKGARLGNGEYMNIDMDQQTVYVQSPYDVKIDDLNDQLNETYVAYGAKGTESKAKQLQEDVNAESYSRSNKVKRAISKSKHVYKNEQWDLVDANDKSDFNLQAVKTDELPEEMRSMSLHEKEVYLNKKSQARKDLQKEIQTLALERKKYVKQVQDSLAQDNQLEEAILNSVKTMAEKQSFTFKE